MYPSPASKSLIAVLLVVKTSSDARLVFHYPPKPGEDDIRYRPFVKNEEGENDSSSSDEEDETSADDLFNVPEQSPSPDKHVSPPELDETGSASPEKSNGLTKDVNEVKWNDILNYRSDTLAKMLDPEKASHKRRVEIGLGGRTFLGRPCYSREDGTWGRKRKRRSSSKSTAGLSMLDSVAEERKRPGMEESLADIEEEVNFDGDSMDLPEFLGDETQDEDSADDSAPKAPIHGPSKPKSSLKMFHLVLVLDSKALRYHSETDALYSYIIKPLVNHLYYEQIFYEYVVKEVSLITDINKRMKRPQGKHIW